MELELSVTAGLQNMGSTGSTAPRKFQLKMVLPVNLSVKTDLSGSLKEESRKKKIMLSKKEILIQPVD